MDSLKEKSKGKILFETIIFAIILLVFQIVSGIIAVFILGVFGIELGKLFDSVLYIFGILSQVFACLYVSHRIKKEYKLEVKSRFSFTKINYVFISGLLLFTISFPTLFEAILTKVIGLKVNPPAEVSFSLEGILAIISIVIVAPIIEEIIFRFGILEKMETKFKKTTMILVGSFLFAIVHGYVLSGFLTVLLFGIILSILYLHTRNLVYPMIMHFINNFLAVLVVLVISSNPKHLLASFPTTPIDYIVLLILSALGFFIMYKTKDKVKYQNNNENELL